MGPITFGNNWNSNTMVKSISILVYVFISGLIAALLLETIEIKQEYPNRVEHLSSVSVTTTIHKGSVSGFAKFVQYLPKGLTVEVDDSQGATFTFSDGVAKFIWMNLPDSSSIALQYRLILKDSTLTEIPMGGKFSYLDENQRMSHDAAPGIIAVGPEPQEKVVQIPDPIVATEREVESIGINRYRVTITVKKENVNGFAKVQDFIPANAIASAVEEQGGVFSVVDKKAKFVWLELPSEAEFSVAYELDLSQAENKTIQAVFGTFSYLHKGSTQTADINPWKPEESHTADVTPNPDTLADETPQIPEANDVEKERLASNETSTSSTPLPDSAAESTTEIVAAPEQEDSQSTSNPDLIEEPITASHTDTEQSLNQPKINDAEDVAAVTSTPAPETGVFYRIQLLAGKHEVASPYFKRQHNYTAEFYLEQHEGWFKYTNGNYDQYKNARDSRVELNSTYNFPGPFVVAYRDGERITVQEALMVTGQKWLK